MTIFNIFRENESKVIEYHFGEGLGNDELPAVNEQNPGPPSISNEQLNAIFDGKDVVEPDVPRNLQFLRNVAIEIAEKTYTDSDCSLPQLHTN